MTSLTFTGNTLNSKDLQYSEPKILQDFKFKISYEDFKNDPHINNLNGCLNTIFIYVYGYTKPATSFRSLIDV